MALPVAITHFYLPDLYSFTLRGQQHVVDKFNLGAKDRQCLCIYQVADSVWHIESPTYCAFETIAMFKRVLNEVVNAVGNSNDGTLATRLNYSTAKNAEDLEHIELETGDEGDKIVLGKPSLPAIKESEAEAKVFWTAGNDKTDFRLLFSESLLQELVGLSGCQLLLKYEQRGVACVGDASTGQLMDLSSRLTNLEVWANRTPHKLHQIEHDGKKDAFVQLPKLKAVPEDVMHRTLVSNDSKWKSILPTTRTCRTMYYNRDYMDYYVAETKAEPVSTDVSWGYFRPETLEIQEIGDASKAIPPSLLDPLPPRTGMTIIPEKDRIVYKWMNEVSAATSNVSGSTPNVSDSVRSKSFNQEESLPPHKRRGVAGPSIQNRPLQSVANIPPQRADPLPHHQRGRGHHVQNISARGVVNAPRGPSSYASVLSPGRGGERGGRGSNRGSNRGGGNSGSVGGGRGIPRSIGRGVSHGFGPRGARGNPAFGPRGAAQQPVGRPLVQLANDVPHSCGVGIESADENKSHITQFSIPIEDPPNPGRADHKTSFNATGQTPTAAPTVPTGFEIITLPVAQMKPSNPGPEFTASDDEEIDLMKADLPGALAHATTLNPNLGIVAGGNTEIKSNDAASTDTLFPASVATNSATQLQSDLPSVQLAEMVNQGVVDNTPGTERIQPVREDDLDDKRGTMHHQRPPKKGQGKQRPSHQDNTRSNTIANFLQQQLIDEYWGRPILPSEPLLPEPSQPERAEANSSQPEISSLKPKDPSMDGLYHVALGILEDARAFRGKLDFEVQLTQNLLYCRTHDTKRFADEVQSKTDKEAFLNDAEATSGIISDATTRITTSARDVQYLLGVKDGNKQYLFEKNPFETSLSYEFVCQIGDENHFTIEIDQEGTQLLNEGTYAIGSIYWHFAEHIYDARVLINGTRTRALDKDDNAGVHELLSNLYIAADSAQGDILLPEIQTHVTAKDFRIKWVMIKRRFRFAPRPQRYENMALQVTEVHDLEIMRNQEGGFRFYADHPSTMAHKGYSFYKASVVPKSQHPSFEENLDLEPGKQATWISEDVLAYSRLAELKELTTMLVARMDSVGKNNTGPWTFKPAGTELETTGNVPGSLASLGKAFW